MYNSSRSTPTLVVLSGVFIFSLWASFWGLIIYVAAHFLRKFW